MANSTLQEWLNRNAYRAFPLEEDSDRTCNSPGKPEICPDSNDETVAPGPTRLPDGVLLDARFFLLGLQDGPVTLERVVVEDDGRVKAVIGLPWRRVELEAHNGIATASADDFSIRLVVSPPHVASSYAGDYRLDTPARFLRSRIVSVPYGIGADTITCGNVTGYGDIRVADGHNTSLDIGRNNLVLTLGRGLGLGVTCPEVGGVDNCHGNVLYFLNGQKADSNGNIQIYGGEGISVSTGTYKGYPAVIITSSQAVNSFIYR